MQTWFNSCLTKALTRISNGALIPMDRLLWTGLSSLALSKAICFGHEHIIVSLLLERGTNPNTPSVLPWYQAALVAGIRGNVAVIQARLRYSTRGPQGPSEDLSRGNCRFNGAVSTYLWDSLRNLHSRYTQAFSWIYASPFKDRRPATIVLGVSGMFSFNISTSWHLARNLLCRVGIPTSWA